ncbi:ABC transporter permease [Pedobacter sp. CFBP9032]|uniref:ABC transporter permease n=1 Tax=Pedobacter sp. CFBP9032 TaxID=3096539 RepID=UPI002A6B3139|nr:ABC transporter permease [Pedobacter sp. CFBP9032]MDY0906623.1 ABC transporter permease [Pedobacter sp. CFBP9032]
MFKLNLKISWRNLFKNKVYTAINIGGLAIGLTAFVLMMLYINHEESYDTWTPDLKNVYQIREKHDFSTPDNKEHWQDATDSRMAALVRENIPQAISVTRVDQEWEWNTGYSVKIDHADPIMIEKIKDADSSFFRVFKYQFLQGDALTAFSAPKSIVLKESVAKRLFGTDKVLGRTLKIVLWRSDPGQDLTITGVVKEPETPQTVGFNAIMRTGNKDKDPDNVTAKHFCQVYARMNAGVDSIALNKTLQNIYVNAKKAAFAKEKRNYNDYYKDGRTPGLMAIQLADVHANPSLKMSWKDKLKPVVGISVFLLLVSVINFVNLATAQSVQRAKEVGVKKVLGANKRQLLLQFLLESALQSITSLFLCVVLVEVVLPSFNQNFNITLSFWHNARLWMMISQLIVLFIVVTLLAGFYPSWVLSNYNPVSVLKGSYGSGLKGTALRNMLVVFQFVISVTFIIAIGVMYQQTTYVSNKDLGFEKGNLINIKSNYEEKFAERLRKVPGVKYVATTTQVLGNAFNIPEEITYKDSKVALNTVTVTIDALPALGVKVLEGRIFAKEYKQDTINSVVINESAAKLIDKHPVGKMYDVKGENEKYTFQIVGVIKDYHNEGFDKTVLPTIYKVTHLGGMSSTNNLLVRFDNVNSGEVIKKIEAEWKALYPDYPMSYVTMKDSLNKILEENNRFMNVIILFSLISVSLSLLGLFALSTFVAKRRTKEVAVRKVLGASNIEIINLLNKSFLILVVVANLISWPIAYVLVKKWLDGFAYRINMPIFPFFLATAVSIIIAILTVSIQARKAAIANPVKALKYD